MGDLKYRWRALRPDLLSGLAYRFVRLVCSTLRVTVEGIPDEPHGAIYCGWHGRSFVFANELRNRGLWVIISHSKDGDMQNHIFKRLGFQIIRGSTGRGGVRAAVEAIRVLKDGGAMALTPDGPRGPSGVVQGGVMLMAQKSGADIVPVGVAASPSWHAKSWDRYLVPMPFGRALIVAGTPIKVPKDATEAEVEEIRVRVEEAMHRLERETEERLGARQPLQA